MSRPRWHRFGNLVVLHPSVDRVVALGLTFLVALALFSRALFGSWVAPGAFFPLYWIVALGAPMLFAPQDRVGAGALFWVSAAAGAVGVGAFLGGGSHLSTGASERRHLTPPADMRRLLTVGALVCTLIGLAAPLIALVSQGYGLRVFASVTALAQAALELSIGRYTGTYTPPVLSQLALPFLYAGPAFGGALAALGNRGARQWAVLVPFLPAMLMTVSQTQRGVTVASAVIWCSGYVATRVLIGRRELLTLRHFAVTAVGGSVVIVLSFAALLARGGVTDLILVADVLPTIYGSFFGHATVFAQWFETGGAGLEPPTWGALTFAGPYQALGLGERASQLFPESVVLASGDETNIYTLFRPLIDDFTITGAMMALLTLGVIGGVAFGAVQRGYREGVPILAGFYATTLFGVLTSIWVYSTIAVGFALFAGPWLVSGYQHRRAPAAKRAVRP